MLTKTEFYIDGEWVKPAESKECDVINPATEEVCAVISLGSEADVDHAVATAKKAFSSYSQTKLEERVALIENLLEIMGRRNEDMAQAVSTDRFTASVWKNRSVLLPCWRGGLAA